METHQLAPGTMETVCLSTDGHAVRGGKKFFIERAVLLLFPTVETMSALLTNE